LKIKDETPVEFGIYPNPTQGAHHIHLAEGNQLQHLQVIDLAGKIVMSDLSGKADLSIGSLMPGIYLINLKTDAFTVSKKLVVE
jgi:hypothetical protein